MVEILVMVDRTHPVALAFCLVLSGCYMPGYTIDAAQQACAGHGGLYEIVDALFVRHARCKDGTLVERIDRHIVRLPK